MEGHQSLNKAIKGYSFGVILSRISGMVRDVVLAYFFGASAQIASFMIAYRFANLMRRILAETPLSSSFIPSFEALASKDEKSALLFFRDLFATLTLVVTGLVGFLMVVGTFCKPLIKFSLNQEILALTVWMLPSIVFLALYGLVVAFLQCQKVFFLSSAAPMAFNGVWIAVTLGMGLQGCLSLKLLACGVVMGFAAQLFFLVPRLVNALKNKLTLKEWLTPSLFHRSLTTLIKPFFLTALGVSTTQINAALDSLFAKVQDPSGPAYLWYAIRIQQVPLALFAVSSAAAVLPLMAKLLKQQMHLQAQKTLENALHKITALMIFSMGGLAAVGLFGLNVLFGRGEFDCSSLNSTFLCLLAYAAGLLFQGLSLVLTSASYAREEFKKPMKISCWAIILHLGCNLLFVQGLQLGPISVALSTSIAALFQMLWLRKEMLQSLNLRLERKLSIKYSALGAVSACCSVCVNYSLFTKLFAKGQLLSFIEASQGCVLGGGVYVGVFYLLERLFSLKEVGEFFRKKLT